MTHRALRRSSTSSCYIAQFKECIHVQRKMSLKSEVAVGTYTKAQTVPPQEERSQTPTNIQSEFDFVQINIKKPIDYTPNAPRQDDSQPTSSFKLLENSKI